jgi:hypothetical protein
MLPMKAICTSIQFGAAHLILAPVMRISEWDSQKKDRFAYAQKLAANSLLEESIVAAAFASQRETTWPSHKSDSDRPTHASGTDCHRQS